MREDQSQSVVVRADDPNVDLYCLTCGYNLRGLSGDPRRCPECGEDNPVSDITIPASLIKKTFAEMESALAFSALGAIAAIPVLVLFVVLQVFVEPDGCSAALFGVAVGCGAIVIGGARKFRSNCQAHPDWLSAYVRYTLWAIGLSALLVSPGIAAVVIFFSSDGLRSHLDNYVPLAVLMSIAVALGIIFWIAPPIYAGLNTVIQPLQRETAVKITQETLRRRYGMASRSNASSN